jgi:hypothetical protein
VSVLRCLFALALLLAPLSATAAAGGPPAAPETKQPSYGGPCAYAPPARAGLCAGLVNGNCSVAPASDYWFCRAINDRLCSLIRAPDDFWLCRAVTTPMCSVARGDGYRLCQGVVGGDCRIAPRPQIWFCAALQASLRRPR